MPRKSRFKRRPNNTGTVVKLSGTRRKPYCARIMSDERDILTGNKKQKWKKKSSIKKNMSNNGQKAT